MSAEEETLSETVQRIVQGLIDEAKRRKLGRYTHPNPSRGWTPHMTVESVGTVVGGEFDDIRRRIEKLEEQNRDFDERLKQLEERQRSTPDDIPIDGGGGFFS